MSDKSGDHTPLLRNTPDLDQETHISMTQNNSSQPGLTTLLVYAAAVTSLIPICTGFVLGYSSPALPAMELDPEIDIDDFQASVFGSVVCLTAVIGGVAGSYVTRVHGRKSAMMFSCLPFTLGWLFIAYSVKSMKLICLGRAFGGFAMGVTFVSAPVYIAEISPAAYRGFLSMLFQVSINIGILLAYILGRYVGWQMLALLGLFPVVAFSVLALRLPGSPRYLLSVHRRQEAKEALFLLRAASRTISDRAAVASAVSTELQTLEDSENMSRSRSSLEAEESSIFGNRLHKRAFWLAFSVIVLQQATGVNVVVFYIEKIYKDAGIEDTNLASIFVALANFGATIVASKFVDSMGRKKLLSLSGLGMFLCQTMFAIYFYALAHSEDGHVSPFLTKIGMACPVLFMISFAIGFGPIPFVLGGELLPSAIKEKSLALANAGTWTLSFIITLTFQSFLVPTFSTAGTFLIFAAFTALSTLLFKFTLIETKGKTLEQIEAMLSH